jgi:hypothetical protein
MSATGPGCVKTKSDLVVMPSEGRIFAFFCSERDHKPQNFGCGYATLSFHTAWVTSRHRAADVVRMPAAIRAGAKQVGARFSALEYNLPDGCGRVRGPLVANEVGPHRPSLPRAHWGPGGSFRQSGTESTDLSCGNSLGGAFRPPVNPPSRIRGPGPGGSCSRSMTRRKSRPGSER